MSKPLIIFRVGWMDDYSGIDKIVGGGSHVKENCEGGEMWNFRQEGGHYYGYVMSKNFAGIDLNRISDEYDWEKGDELENVDIVFISTKPSSGQVIIGWYLGATIFHKEYRQRRGKKNKGDWSYITYVSEVNSSSAKLLPSIERNHPIPRGKGFPGTSNVWYGDNGTLIIESFKNKIRSYISQFSPDKSTKNSRKKKPNKELILAIEQAAVKLTWKYYESRGYTVKSVEKDNVGWDLEASNKETTLLVEVKGHRGNVIQFELTPNEYTQMQSYSESYRVTVVRNALDSPDLVEFMPAKDEEYWYLEEVDGTEVVRLNEKIAAKAVQISF